MSFRSYWWYPRSCYVWSCLHFNLMLPTKEDALLTHTPLRRIPADQNEVQGWIFFPKTQMQQQSTKIGLRSCWLYPRSSFISGSISVFLFESFSCASQHQLLHLRGLAPRIVANWSIVLMHLAIIRLAWKDIVFLQAAVTKPWAFAALLFGCNLETHCSVWSCKFSS